MAETRTMIIVSVVLYAVAMLFLIIGFSTPNWSDGSSGSHSGLWKSCSAGSCYKINLDNAADFFKATVAFMILALIAAIAAFFGYLVLIAGGALQLAAGVFELLAIIIYGGTMNDKYHIGPEYLGYSFWLSMISGILFLVNGAALIWIARTNGINTKPKMPFTV